MDSQTLRLTGKFELSQPLDVDKTYSATLQVDIISRNKVSQQNGEYEYIHTAKVTEGALHYLGEKIKFEKKSSQSQKLRGQLFHIAEEAQIDGNDFYESTMTDIRHFLPLIIPQMAEWKKQGL